MDVKLIGRLDTISSPMFEKYLVAVLGTEGAKDVKKLTVDFSELDYISSAGLRVLLILHKAMDRRLGKLIITYVKPVVQSVFEITGFAGILNVS